MYDLIKSRAKITPYLLLDWNKGYVELKGSSLMEDAKAFYDPMLEWGYACIKNPRDIRINFDFEHFNGASARILLEFLRTISKIRESGCTLEVNWFYDEDEPDIKDLGFDFSIMSKLTFNFVEKKHSTASCSI